METKGNEEKALEQSALASRIYGSQTREVHQDLIEMNLDELASMMMSFKCCWLVTDAAWIPNYKLHNILTEMFTWRRTPSPPADCNMIDWNHLEVIIETKLCLRATIFDSVEGDLIWLHTLCSAFRSSAVLFVIPFRS